MAGLGKGLKALAGSVTPPKKDINPLLKQMEEAFTTPDPAPFGEGSEFETEVVGRFYSPVYSAIEKMPIGKEGTKGENIMGYLNKRAPNVDKSELESFNINLEPNKKYTREEVLSLAREKGSPDYTIEKFKVGEYTDTQRQNISDKELEYVELILQGKQNYTRRSSRTHFGGKKNIGHSRVSIRQEMPEGGPLSKKIVDRPRYLLIEELQSDLSRVRDDLPNDTPVPNYYDQGSPLDPDVDVEEFNSLIFYPRISSNFDELVDDMDDLFNVFVDKNVVATIKDFYLSTFNPELIDTVDDFKKIKEDDSYKNALIKRLKDEHNIDVAGRDIETVALDAIRKKSDTSSGYTDFTSDGERELPSDEVLEREIKRTLQDTKRFIDNVYLTSTPKSQAKPEEIQTLPVATRSEYVKRLLLANIAYAKQNGINKIVIPNYKEIARQRTGDLEWVMYERPENDPLRKKYEQSLREGTTAELAQKYYEDVFKPIYEDAVKKVLNSLKAETKGAIKTKTKELKYPDLTEPDSFRKSNALEIDITEFEYDPETSIFRFAEGGAVPMEEQMKLFEEGGLRDEGGMVDEESGNDVPIGSTRKEVRDDIPAMLSEGEFVFPADVVRYLGLERLMNLRQEAKMGLKQMEAMGQMGNSDEATIPDDLPFGMADLVIVEGEMEPQEKAQGGVIHANQGTFVTPIFDPQNQDVRPYTNDGGQTVRYIPFLGGNPVYPIPEGYVPLDQATAPEAEETPEAIPTGGDDDRTPLPEPSEFQKAGGWDMDFGNPPDPKKVDLWISEAEKASTFGKVATGVMAAINPLAGIAAYGASKLNEKGIRDNVQRALEAASKTPVKGQMARINKVDERLTTKTGQSIIGQAVSDIIGGLGSALGLTKEEEDKAKAAAIHSSNTPPEPPNEEEEKEFEKVLTSPESVLNRFEEEDARKIRAQLAAAGTPDLSPKEPEVELEVGPAAPVAPETPEAIPTAPETPTITGAPEVPTLQTPDKIPAGMGIQGFESSVTVPEEGETPSTLPLRTEQAVVGAGMTKIQTALDEIRASMPRRGPVSGMTIEEKLKDPMAPFEKGWEKLTEAISQVSTTDYTPPTQPTATTVSTGGGDDDGPSFADEMRQQQQAERQERQESAKQAAKDIAKEAKSTGKSIAEVGRERAPSSESKTAAEKAKEEGDPRNMKSGGLASRRKKKK